jgi:ribosomal protein L17
MVFMEFTEKDIEKYIEKRKRLERDLADEIAFGEPSKTTLRKLEELKRIIEYGDLLNYSKELKRKTDYYENLLKRHNISYLK